MFRKYFVSRKNNEIEIYVLIVAANWNFCVSRQDLVPPRNASFSRGNTNLSQN